MRQCFWIGRGGNWRSAVLSVMRLSLALGTAVVGIEANAARALDGRGVAPALAAWCIVQRDGVVISPDATKTTSPALWPLLPMAAPAQSGRVPSCRTRGQRTRAIPPRKCRCPERDHSCTAHARCPVQIHRQYRSPNRLTGLRQTKRWQMTRRPLARRRPEVRRRSRLRFRLRSCSKHRSRRAQIRLGKRAMLTVPSAG